MPCRIVDGDAWARSRKIKDGVEEKYRKDYVLWLTLAEANGTFECDLEQIHADLYAFQLPATKMKHVRKMFEQFLRAGVLVTWQDRGKTWGYFPGSEKAGRLVSKEHLKRYKDLPPFYPGLVRDTSGSPPAWLGVGLVKEGSRSGAEQPTPPSSHSVVDQKEQELTVKLKDFVKKCVPIWQEYFGEGAVLRLPSFCKQDVEFMTETYKEEDLLAAFRLYAKDRFDHGHHDPFAVGKFMSKVADYMLKVKPANVSTALDDQNAAAAERYARENAIDLPTNDTVKLEPLAGGIEDFLDKE